MGAMELRMKRIIQKALQKSGTGSGAIVALLRPGHAIPLGHTCGAVLDHDMVRICDPALVWAAVAGKVLSPDDGPLQVSVPLGDIAWIMPAKEVR